MINLSAFLLIILNSTLTGELRFSASDLGISRDGEYTRIRLANCEITDEVGAPELPVQIVKIALPYGARITDVEIVSVASKEIAGAYTVPCVQPPYILSQSDASRRCEPKQGIYLSDKPYPPEIIQYCGSGIFDNNQICELAAYPVQYNPRSGKLILHTTIKWAVKYERGLHLSARTGLAKKLVINSEDVLISPRQRDRQDFNYLIITDPPIDTVFQRLADWKTKKGVLAKVRTVDWILSHYAGRDSAEQIRNYIKLLPDSSVEYVLLGGDVDFIPCRFAFAMECSAGYWPGREDSLPCDLYYADLQGDWDLDNDGSYGEIEDSIDLYPELHIGRAPVKTIAEAQRFINKVLTYEKNPETAYLDNALFAAELLWTDPYTDMAVHKNSIGDISFPANFELTKLYQSQGNETKGSVMAAIRVGQGLFNHDGHGWIDLIQVGGWQNRIYIADFDTITNAPRYGIIYSIGCWTSAFDLASVSEAYVNSPNGGGIAYIGNSSYGWGSPGNPGFGHSDRFDSRFFYTLLNENVFHIGEALSLCKAHFIPFSREKNVYRWHQYQLNLLGDPEMPVWTALPETLVVQHPQSLPLGSGQVLISVKDGTGSPVKDALVCLMKGAESYAAAHTDEAGTAFIGAAAATAGSFDLTVTAQNHLPEEIVIPVVSGPYTNFCGWTINDSAGNNDGIANPSEAIVLPTTIKNCGNATASNIALKLRSAEPQLTINDSTASYASLAPGDSVTIDDAFAVTVGSIVNGKCVDLSIEVSDSNDTLYFSPGMLIGTPIIEMVGCDLARPPALPGQTESLYVRLKNAGYGIAYNTAAKLASFDPYVSLLFDSTTFGDIMPGSTASSPDPFILSISPACPSSYIARLPMAVFSETCAFEDTIQLLVGQTGFADDIESGATLWITGGTGNLWHISTRKAFSPTHSWYCGDSTTARYLPGMNCYIQSVPFMVQANSLLRFRRWFNVPIYGTDGIYVISMRNGIADTMDFIGTGGALRDRANKVGQDDRAIQSEWFEEKYDLSQYWPGDTIQIQVAFVSDTNSNVGEGFYIDDVIVEYMTPVGERARDTTPLKPGLWVYPNPFHDRTTIKCQIPSTKSQPSPSPQPSPYEWEDKGEGEDSNVSLKIYDVSGRVIKSFNLSTPPRFLADCSLLSTSVQWNGIDDSGSPLPAGVYFIRLDAGESKMTGKAILLR